MRVETRSLRNAIVVLAGKQAASKRAPDLKVDDRLVSGQKSIQEGIHTVVPMP